MNDPILAPRLAPDFVERLAHGVTLSDTRIRALLGLDLELNAQGIAIWLDRHAA